LPGTAPFRLVPTGAACRGWEGVGAPGVSYHGEGAILAVGVVVRACRAWAVNRGDRRGRLSEGRSVPPPLWEGRTRLLRGQLKRRWAPLLPESRHGRALPELPWHPLWPEKPSWSGAMDSGSYEAFGRYRPFQPQKLTREADILSPVQTLASLAEVQATTFHYVHYVSLRSIRLLRPSLRILLLRN
jgi:hypothetical protein